MKIVKLMNFVKGIGLKLGFLPKVLGILETRDVTDNFMWSEVYLMQSDFTWGDEPPVWLLTPWCSLLVHHMRACVLRCVES